VVAAFLFFPVTWNWGMGFIMFQTFCYQNKNHTQKNIDASTWIILLFGFVAFFNSKKGLSSFLDSKPLEKFLF